MYLSTDDAAPKVSVVMPVYNAAAFLPTTVASVQAQSFADWELIAVDDGSTDASAQLLAEVAAADLRIRVLKTPGNRGAGVARNLAMDIARGRFVAFLDADDLWHPEKLARHLEWLQAHPAGLSYTAYQRQSTPDAALVAKGVGVPSRVNYRQLLVTNVIGCSTAIIDRAIIGEMRMPDLRLRQDFAFWLAILRQHGPACGLPATLTTYRVHAGQVSGDKARAARATWAMYRHHLRLSVPKAGWLFANYALRGFMRHRIPRLARTLGWLQQPAEMPPTF